MLISICELFVSLCVFTLKCRNECRMERPVYPCMVVVFEGYTVVFYLVLCARCFSDGEVPGHCEHLVPSQVYFLFWFCFQHKAALLLTPED